MFASWDCAYQSTSVSIKSVRGNKGNDSADSSEFDAEDVFQLIEAFVGDMEKAKWR